ncbi:MAG: YggS family pyridoxal phosphate-dependent enzyme [Nitriliruptorales bacterium]|nr:YggS family pyridoxal phosphate-dependent enzyme [Nitriliruptorales bacterium]
MAARTHAEPAPTSLGGGEPEPAIPVSGGRVTADEVPERLAAVRRRIAAAAERVLRDPDEIRMVAVTKMVAPEMIVAAQRAGQIDFGENRAQEFRRKLAVIEPPVAWHFVGRVQRNKVADVTGLAQLIHSVDRLELAEALAARAQRDGLRQRILVQVNTGLDPAKAGVVPEEAPALIERVRELSGLACEGLMTVPPLAADPRPLFARLRALRDTLRSRFPEIQQLSMGMSGDFEVAIEEGSTIVRLGEALFGPRPLKPA